MLVNKRDGTKQEFDFNKIKKAVKAAFSSCGIEKETRIDPVIWSIKNKLELVDNELSVEKIQDIVETSLMQCGEYKVAKSYIIYREKHRQLRESAEKNLTFIDNYIHSDNTANATIDDNSNVSNHNIAVLNAEIHKENNQNTNYRMLENELRKLYPNFDYKQMMNDFNTIAYLHDSSSQIGMPYCVAITMYPFLTHGIKKLGGLSAKPESLESFCGIFINMVFAIASQYKGACATPGFLLCMDWFCRQEWGNDYIYHLDKIISHGKKDRTIETQILQYFQQVTYSINQPASARGGQSVFWNISIFDKEFFNTMYGEFYFPDGSAPIWETFNWLQKKYLHWLNQERLKCILTFPVVSVALIYKDKHFIDQELFEYACQEYAEGNSFFTYINDSPESLSSCCFSKDQKILWKSSTSGVHLTTFEEFKNLPYAGNKENFKIFHNGSWVKGKFVELPGRKMYEITTFNNKKIVVTDNHLNPTLRGDISTNELTTNDYLLFNQQPANVISENDEHLTYEQGFVVGSFLGDGSFGSEQNGVIYDINFSQNLEKHKKCMEMLDIANQQVGGQNKPHLASIYNNVYPVRISSKELAAFIIKWTNWKRGTYAFNKKLNLNCLLQSIEFRKGILDGWYFTDGGNSNRCYTTSPELAEDMEVLIMSLGMNSIIDISDRTDEDVVIRGEIYNRNYPLYCVRWYEPANHRRNKDIENSWIKRNNSIYFKIKEIKEVEYSGNVYCFECDEKEPYFTLPNGIITHNCRLSSKISKPQFNFTNGQIGEMTGSQNVITLNFNRIIQDWYNSIKVNVSVEEKSGKASPEFIGSLLRTDKNLQESLKVYLTKILERIYKYQTAYNSCLRRLLDAGLLTTYTAGFIDLKKQYLTIGINGLNQGAEFLGYQCNKNESYKKFCNLIFSTIKEQNQLHKSNSLMFNTEFTPCESASIKLYNRDKKDGCWVPSDTNLYASYIYKPNDPNISILDKIYLHGRDFCGDNLDGGSAAHINIDSHLSKEQYIKLLTYAGEVGCKYLTFNVPNAECQECGFITKTPITKCPHCGSTKIDYYDRVIGYLTKIKNWSAGRQQEQKTRIYSHIN